MFSRKETLQAAKSFDHGGVTMFLDEISTAITDNSNVDDNEVTFLGECWTPNAGPRTSASSELVNRDQFEWLHFMSVLS